MITALLHLLRLCPFLFGGRRQLALENVALRQQLAVYKRAAYRPKLRRTDRLFWVVLSRLWTGWRKTLVIVAPDTVVRWQRRRFREHWTKLSRPHPVGGRRSVSRSPRWSSGWPRPIPCGAPRESTVSCRSSASSSRSARSRG